MAEQPKPCCKQLCSAVRNAGTNGYFWACFVYLVYTLQAIAVDYCSDFHPDVATFINETDWDNETDSWITDTYWDVEPAAACDQTGSQAPINKQYVGMGIVHVINAIMFGLAWWTWMQENKHRSLALRIGILVPEALNVVEAGLYLHTATLYGDASENCEDFYCDKYLNLHHFELAAAIIETFAAFGWCWSWWVTHRRGPGRGLTLWDPDLHSSILLVVPSIIYIVYNARVMANPNDYGTDYLYVKADVIYVVNAGLYVIGAMRDAGFWWWVPMPGCKPLPPDKEMEPNQEQQDGYTV
jgi:hypothetical protein